MIRLLNIHTLHFEEFPEYTAPAYAIASHRWRNDEAIFKDVLKGRNRDSAGFTKIQGFCDLIKSWDNGPLRESINWLWIDTCCIDKKSSAELSEAINSMFEWYANAEVCVAYLFDVQKHEEWYDFESSDWFKRGWTLQELIAPSVVLFTDCDWRTIGHKAGDQLDYIDLPEHVLGPRLNEKISTCTKISEKVLFDHTALEGVSYEMRLSWMNERQTTRVEDEAYCLLGIFDVHMPLIYGERLQATSRLLNEVLRRHTEKMHDLAEQTRSERSESSDLAEDTEEPRNALRHDIINLQNRIAQLEDKKRTYRLHRSVRMRNPRQIRNYQTLLASHSDFYKP